MKKGYFTVSNEIMAGSDWPLILEELNKVFTTDVIITGALSTKIFYGTSHLFEDCNEVEGKQYTVWFKTNDKKPAFDRFEKV